MSIKIYIILFILFFSASVSCLKAQEINSSENIQVQQKENSGTEAKKGTYQFIIHPSKKEYVFTTEILKEIERNRDQKLIKYIQAAPSVEIKILPREYIESPGFKPLQERMYTD